jgi:hypothetical protein
VKNYIFYFLFLFCSCSSQLILLPSSDYPALCKMEYTSSKTILFNQIEKTLSYYNTEIIHENRLEYLICFKVNQEKIDNNTISTLYGNCLIEQKDNDNVTVYLYLFSNPFESGMIEQEKVGGIKVFTPQSFFKRLKQVYNN